jgi:hypothetical protein
MPNDVHSFRSAHLERHIAKHTSAENFLRVVNAELQRHGLNELDASYLSQLRSKAKNSRNIGAKTARKLEIGLRLEPGTMDRPIDDEGTQSPEQLDAAEVAQKWLDLSADQRALVHQTIDALRQQNQSSD